MLYTSIYAYLHVSSFVHSLAYSMNKVSGNRILCTAYENVIIQKVENLYVTMNEMWKSELSAFISDILLGFAFCSVTSKRNSN